MSLGDGMLRSPTYSLSVPMYSNDNNQRIYFQRGFGSNLPFPIVQAENACCVDLVIESFIRGVYFFALSNDANPFWIFYYTPVFRVCNLRSKHYVLYCNFTSTHFMSSYHTTYLFHFFLSRLQSPDRYPYDSEPE